MPPTEASIERARRGYYLSGWATGPDTVLATFWGPALLAIASLDQTCDASSTTVATANACTPNAQWNATLWAQYGGQACSTSDAFGVAYFSYRPDVPACVTAYNDYSASTGYTCNCSGFTNRYAFLGGANGVRASIIPLLQINIAYATVSLISPLLGVWLDHTPHRLATWRYLWLAGVATTLCMAILWTSYVWVGGLIFAFFTQCLTELVTVPRMAYLVEIARDDATRVKLGSIRQSLSFLSQLCYVILLVVVSLVVPLFLDEGAASNTIVGAIAAALCAIWYLAMMPIALSRMFEIPVLQRAPRDASLCSLAFGSLRSTLASMWRSNREAFKYLAVIFCMQNGAASTAIAVLSQSYLPSYLLLNFTQLGIIIALVLICGAGSVYALSLLTTKYPERFTVRRLLLAIIVGWIVVDTLVPLVLPPLGVTPDGGWGISFIICCIIGGIFAGAIFAGYFAIVWTGFSTMVPIAEAASYAGILYFVQNLGLIAESFIYLGVLQSTNSYRIAIVTLIPWVFVALIIALFIDFDKGKRDVAALDQSTEIEVTDAKVAPVDDENPGTEPVAA